MLLAVLLILIGPAGAAFPGVDRSTAPIIVVFPAEGAAVPFTGGEFVLGSVSDPKALFTINGLTVAVHSNGAFLGWLPVEPGSSTFRLNLDLKTGPATLARTVVVSSPAAPLSQKPPAIDPESLWPKLDQELMEGDVLLARMRASPGLEAKFRLSKGDWQPMREANPALGIYEGAAVIDLDDEPVAEAAVEYQAGGRSGPSALSRGRVTINAGPPRVAIVKAPGPVGVRTGPGEEEFFSALPGTRFLVGGRAGDETKMALANGQAGWIDTRHLELLPAGAHPPRAVTDAITVRTEEGLSTVRIGLTDRVPFTVDEDDDLRCLTIRIHYAWAHTNWIVYKSADPLVSEIRFRQETSDIVAVKILLSPEETLWGYHASVEPGAIKLELRRPPKLAAAPASPLKGRAIFLDPGHGPSSPGAVGPLGTREADVNFALAKAVEALLLKEGAVPILSRAAPEEDLALPDRPRLAWEKKADVFVSLHNNNLADAKNPFLKDYGFSIFYYQPHSLELAKDVYRAFQRHVPLAGEEVRFGNLRVLRLTGMPAILTESAYMTFPAQEEMLLDARFRGRIADSILEGLRTFFERARTRRKPPAPEVRAPPLPPMPRANIKPAGAVPRPRPVKAGRKKRKGAS